MIPSAVKCLSRLLRAQARWLLDVRATGNLIEEICSLDLQVCVGRRRDSWTKLSPQVRREVTRLPARGASGREIAGWVSVSLGSVGNVLRALGGVILADMSDVTGARLGLGDRAGIRAGPDDRPVSPEPSAVHPRRRPLRPSALSAATAAWWSSNRCPRSTDAPLGVLCRSVTMTRWLVSFAEVDVVLDLGPPPAEVAGRGFLLVVGICQRRGAGSGGWG